jgi:hypothetical protein
MGLKPTRTVSMCSCARHPRLAFCSEMFPIKISAAQKHFYYEKISQVNFMISQSRIIVAFGYKLVGRANPDT